MMTRRNRYTTNQEPSTPSTVAADDDYDIFDGLDAGIDAIDYNIEDEIEIPPPPPPPPLPPPPTTTTTTTTTTSGASAGDFEARPLPPALSSRAPRNQHDSSSYNDTLNSNLTGNDTTTVTDGEEIELERVVSSFFCGVGSGSSPSSGIGSGVGDYSTTTTTTKKWWNRLGSMMKIKQYEELQDELCLQDKEPDQAQAQAPRMTQPDTKVTANIANVYDYSNGKDKDNRKINNNIDNDNLEVMKSKNEVEGDDAFNIVAVASTAYNKDKDNISCVARSRDTVIQHSMLIDEDGDHDLNRDHDIEKNGVKVTKKGGDDKKQQSISSLWWKTMGEKKLFGISYRLILLICINLIALIVVICLAARFKGINKNSTLANTGVDGAAAGLASDGNINNNGIFDTIDNTTTATTTIDNNNGDEEASNSGSNDNKENENDSELLLLCNEDGVTVDDDGVILSTNQAIESGEYYCSQSKMYMIGMLDGDLSIINVNTNETVWSAGVADGIRTILRADGSLIIVDDNRLIIWKTESIPTNNNGDSAFFNFNLDRQLVFWNNNEGIIAIQQVPATTSDNEKSKTPSTYWMDGSPNTSNNNNNENLEFPVRGTFYFPTFDSTAESWENLNGRLPMHEPALGWYSSSDPMVAKAHVEAIEYGKINLGIASWEGPDTNFDRSRMTMLLDETTEQNTEYLKWSICHESERRGRPDADEIRTDLEYLQKWFAWKESWAHIDGKPVIFVNNDDGCDVTERWNDASNDWYVVLRIFDGYDDCEYQPDSWHDQSVNDGNDGIDIKKGLYHNIAPGEWLSGRRQPVLERLSQGEWCEHVQGMIDSNEQWQMIDSFNEAAQGTSIEPSDDWRSDSGYGYYLDCLNDESMY